MKKQSSILLLFLFFIQFMAFSQAKKQITLDDIFKNGTFKGKSVYGLNAMNDGIHYTSSEHYSDTLVINKYAYKTGEKVATIFSSENLNYNGKKLIIDDYQFSPDEKKLLISTEMESIYRHSTKEINYIYDLATKKLSLLSLGEKQRYATFSPSANQVAFVRNNNLFIKDLTSNKETKITTDGKINHIINGATDWVYEEEFGFAKAFFWSPNGNNIAYYRFDESAVKEFSMDIYTSLYPTQYKFKYPKAGEENSKVTIHIYNLKTAKNITPELGDYEYIPRIKWTKNDTILSIQKMNRHQNELNLLLVDVTTNKTTNILHETSDTYIDITDNLTFLNDKKTFIWTSEKSGYNHIYLRGLNGKEINQITTGNWDVASYLGYNEKLKTVYYISSESSPLNREMYAIKKNGKSKKRLTPKKGTNRVRFSKGLKYFINYYSNANQPSLITLNDASGKLIRELESNKSLNKTLSEYKISKKEFFKFKTKNNDELNGWMLKPVDFDSSKRYPVLMYVYGGPGSQTVQNSFGGSRDLWYNMLAQKGYIIVSVDNRGTGARGVAFKKITYKQLGKYEVEDQIESAKYLAALPYVDGKRIGIWGWSYGGYMSSNCLMQGNEVFKMAISVAPVTNWRYYDSIYTERYMQTPQENPNGYDDNSPINHVEKLKGKLLLVHGMADDNVHFQNSVELVEKFIRANKQIDFAMYPNRNHGIHGHGSSIHLYTKITNFIFDNL